MDQMSMKVKVEFENGEAYEGVCTYAEVDHLYDEFGENFKGIPTRVFRGWHINLDIKPKRAVKRYRWWYEVDDCGHTYDGVTNAHYTESEFLHANGPVERYELISATERVYYE